MLSLTNPRQDKCPVCRKVKDGATVEFADKRFPGPIFLCWSDMKNQAMPPKEKSETKE